VIDNDPTVGDVESLMCVAMNMTDPSSPAYGNITNRCICQLAWNRDGPDCDQVIPDMAGVVTIANICFGLIGLVELAIGLSTLWYVRAQRGAPPKGSGRRLRQKLTGVTPLLPPSLPARNPSHQLPRAHAPP
jgi:hypothetical protein